MIALDNAAHALVMVLAATTRTILDLLDWMESSLRALLHSGGMGPDWQTVMVILVITAFLLGTMRLLRGRIRFTLSIMLFLFLAHALERIAHGPLIG